jgi:hypothetical protein
LIWLSVRIPGFSGTAAVAEKEVINPIASFRMSVANVFVGLRGNILNLKESMLGDVGAKSEYEADYVHTYTVSESSQNSAGTIAQ